MAKEALAEKDRIARREAKKHRKLEMLRAYGVEVQEHVVAASADGGTDGLHLCRIASHLVFR